MPFSFQNRAGIPLRVELRIIGERVTVEDFDDGEKARLLFLNPALPLTDSGLGHWDLVRFLSQSSCTRLMEEYW